MTDFEVSRLKAAFVMVLKENEYKYNRDKEILEESGDKDALKFLKHGYKFYEHGVMEIGRVLELYGLTESRADSTRNLLEKKFNDPEQQHTYIFRVTFGNRAPMRYLQDGLTAEEAQFFLDSHIKFDQCSQTNPEPFTIELLDQLN